VVQPVLESIEIEGFLSLGALNVLIDANGAGKSNLVRAFEMLGRIEAWVFRWTGPRDR
jgi:predicted ATPase